MSHYDYFHCINTLNTCGANYFTRPIENGGVKIVCYSPYYVYDNKTGEASISCYVLHWVDTYNAGGEFISHKVYESVWVKNIEDID